MLLEGLHRSMSTFWTRRRQLMMMIVLFSHFGYYFNKRLLACYCKSVALKSRLGVTERSLDHWKQHCSIEHHIDLPLQSSYFTLNIVVSVKCGFEVTQGHWKRYHFLFAFHSNCGLIYSHFGDIHHPRMAWPWILGLGSFKVIENIAVR